MLLTPLDEGQRKLIFMSQDVDKESFLTKAQPTMTIIDKFRWHAIFPSNSRLEMVRTQGLRQKTLGCWRALTDFVSGLCWDAWTFMLQASTEYVDFFTCQRSWLDPTSGWVWHNWRHEQRPGCWSLTEVRPYLLCLQCRWPQSTTQNSIQSCFLLQVSFLALRRLLSFMFWHLDSFCTGCTPMVPQNYFKLVWMFR